MQIQAISSVHRPSSVADVAAVSESSKPATFTDVLAGVVQSANQDLQSADTAIADFESGKTDDLNSVVMASVKADLSFRFVMEMRNRVTESYQELSRMQF